MALQARVTRTREWAGEWEDHILRPNSRLNCSFMPIAEP